MTRRIFTVEPHEAGKTVLDWLRARLGVSSEAARGMLARRQVRLNGNPCSNPAWKLRLGARVEVPRTDSPATAARKPSTPPGPRPRLCHLDDQIVVVDKPAGLTTMRHAEEAAEFGSRGRRFLPVTLADLLPDLIRAREGGKPGLVRAVHRLDRDTTGLVVFARTPEAESHLGKQFRAHTTERLYQAIVRGRVTGGRIESWLVEDRGDGRRGSSGQRGEGQYAVTHVRVAEELGPFTLVECRLETGRTHQVRIHLGEAGTPLCGERVYDRPVHGRPMPDGSGIERVALHAALLGLEHPGSGERLTWTTPLPGDMSLLLEQLRRGKGTS